MRIVCQKCSAAYAIDDKFITPKGVRAQCPRCRHLQLVKKEEQQGQASEIAEISSPDARAAVAAAAAGAAAMRPSSPAMPAPLPSPAASDFLFDLDGPPPPSSAARQPDPVPAPAPAASAFANPPSNVGTEMDFGEFDLGDLPAAPVSQPPPQSQPPPRAVAPSMAPSMAMDFSVPDPLDSQPTAPFPAAFAPAPAPMQMQAPSPPSEAALVKCRTCGKGLTDPFDQAIGICDDCRSKVDSSSQPASAPPPAAPSAPLAPFQPPPQAFAPPELASAAPPALPPAPPAPRRASAEFSTSGSYDTGGGSKARLVMGIIAVLLVAGIGTVLAIKKPWQRKPPPMAARLTPGADKPIERALAEWAGYFPELTGSSADHLAAGEEQLAKDTATAYLAAEEEFQKAFVLDKSSDRAIAGWVLAMAFGRGSAIEDEKAKIAEELLVAAEQRGGAGRVYTAHAHLLLARGGNMNDIKVMAERGKNSPSDRDKALALLALGQSMLAKNPQYAAESFNQSLKLDPKLKRAYLSQSQLLLTMGRYREAVANIEKRLELDPDQWEAADALARTWIEVGEVAKAKKVYQAAQSADARNFRARLALAVLAYQHENDNAGAIAQLDAIVNDDKMDPKDQLEALGHRAAAQRVSGQLDDAIASAEKGMGFKANDPHVNLQRFLIALEQNSAPEARAQWPFIQGKLGDAALEGTLEGCLVLIEGKPNDAMKLFAAANQKDPRRIDALLLAGAAAAKAKNESRAWEFVLKAGLKGDIRYGGPLPVMARYFVRPQDLLRQAIGSFEGLKVEADDPNVPMAEGLIAWYANDFVAAEKHFARVVAADPASGHGLAFRSLLALRRKETANAVKLAQKAVAAEREVGLGHYAVGMALMATNQFETAKAPFRKAFELEPKCSATQVRLAEIEMKQKKPDEARRLLAAVLLVDPLYFDAKKALYALP